MIDEQDFPAMIQRARSGDPDAAAELVRLYEPELRRYIRFRLTSASLLRVFDSLDIWQSVLAKFFVHLDGGKFDLHEPVQLRKLLMTIARNRIHDQIRYQRAECRDTRRVAAWTHEMLDTLTVPEETPSQIVARKEVLTAIQEKLSDEERYLLDQRAGGRSWNALADELQSRPDAIRKRMVRAVNRVAQELGFSEGS